MQLADCQPDAARIILRLVSMTPHPIRRGGNQEAALMHQAGVIHARARAAHASVRWPVPQQT